MDVMGARSGHRFPKERKVWKVRMRDREAAQPFERSAISVHRLQRRDRHLDGDARLPSRPGTGVEPTRSTLTATDPSASRLAAASHLNISGRAAS
jgi:hypothetical protein